MNSGSVVSSQAELSFMVQRLLFQRACNPMLDDLIAVQKRELAILRSRVAKAGRHLVVLLDVEGTTTPLPFVTTILYPASLDHLASFLEANYAVDPKVTESVKLCAAEHPPLADALASGDRGRVVSTAYTRLAELINANSKAAYLKTIQGLIWKSLYTSRVIEGHLFEDTKDLLVSCATLPNASVWIYSSGSIEAQQLLFRHSTLGDMTPYIRGYLDPPLVGAKTVPSSYVTLRRVVEQRLQRPCTIVFVTDSPGEIAAAQQGGIDAAVMSLRPLNTPVSIGELNALGDCASLCSLAHLLPGRRQSALGEVQQLYNQVGRYRRLTQPQKSFL